MKKNLISIGREYGRAMRAWCCGKARIWVVALGFVSFSFDAAIGSQVTEEHYYTETQKDSQHTIHWQLREGPELILTATMPDEISVCRINGQLETLSWQVIRDDETTQLTARREKTKILISGILGGEYIERTIKVDDAPWYQAGSISLRRLIDDQIDEVFFWILRPEHFTAHKLKAKRKGRQTLKYRGQPVVTDVVEVRPAGILGPLWSGTYWFRAEDLALFRYRSPTGFPGSSETIIQLVTASSDSE